MPARAAAEEPTIVLAGGVEEPLRDLASYRAVGGYAQLERARAMTPQAVTEQLIQSNLRGRGGAFFPTGRKASFIPTPDKVAKPIYLTVNADESEPGTFKDREIMLRVPHRLLEGCLIAAYAIQSQHVFIYIRGEYTTEYDVLSTALEDARGAGLLGDVRLVIHRGAGAYICGEETALLESLEGKRAQPRSRPPFPAVKGAWGRPTLLNNVETLATVPAIINMGGAEYAKLGTEKSPGTRLLTVSGNVKRPGVYEVELGATFRHVIMDLAGGPPDGRKVRVFWPGGSSAPVLPESMLDTTTDMEALAAAKSMGGSGGVIVMDDSHCVVRAAYRLLQFYAHESCGKCTPCRVGGDWAVRMYERILGNDGSQVELDNLRRVSDALQNGRCLCGLGDSAGWVIDSTFRHFYSEYEDHAIRHECKVGPHPPGSAARTGSPSPQGGEG